MAREAINKAGMFLQAIDEATSCARASNLAAGAGLYYASKAEKLARQGATALAAATTKVAKRFGVGALVLATANSFGFC